MEAKPSFTFTLNRDVKLLAPQKNTEETNAEHWQIDAMDNF
jgi:hypothetical protein